MSTDQPQPPTDLDVARAVMNRDERLGIDIIDGVAQIEGNVVLVADQILRNEDLDLDAAIQIAIAQAGGSEEELRSTWEGFRTALTA